MLLPPLDGSKKNFGTTLFLRAEKPLYGLPVIKVLQTLFNSLEMDEKNGFQQAIQILFLNNVHFLSFKSVAFVNHLYWCDNGIKQNLLQGNNL